MSEWKEYKLEDVCDAIYSGGTPSSMVKDYWNGSLPWLSSGETNQRYIFSTEKCITQEGVDNSSTRYAYKDSTVVASAGQGHTRGQASLLCINTYVNQSVIVLKPNEKCLNPYFLYYNIDNRYNELRQLSDGTSTRGSLSGKILKELPIKIPSLVIQSKIASILKSFDDKIEVNKRISDNLEQQAQALFKHWFVDFAPFKDGKFVESELGLIPEGWRVGMIGDYCVIRSGFAFKSSWWQDEGVKVVKIKNITDSGTLDMSDCSCVSEEHASLASSFQTKSGDLLIAMTGATIGKFCMVNGQETYCVNQRVGKFFLGDNPLEKLPFIYCILKRDDVNKEIVNKGQGSAQPNISGKDIEEIKIIIPPQSIIKQFNEELYSLFELRINGELENHRLSTLRDTLLPKLMSGQIKL